MEELYEVVTKPVAGNLSSLRAAFYPQLFSFIYQYGGTLMP
jgi:hypothetical protein